MKKWLMVLDQVGHATFQGACPPGSGASPVPLSLDYVPRTTPVGHATISTGLWPSEHLVQGRTWCEMASGHVHRVHYAAQLPNLYPVMGTVFEQVYQTNLAAKLRRGLDHHNAAIVAVAAKDFIPFLFGAWSTDVSVYPRTTKPVRTGHGFAIDIVFDTFTPMGEQAVLNAQPRLVLLAAALVPGWAVHWLAPMPALLGPQHVRHAMRWDVPPGWGKTEAMVGKQWFKLIDAQIVNVDQFYSDIATELLAHVQGAVHEIVIQSAVATDTYGHFHGPSSPQYATALQAGIQRARNLHAAGWSVLVTSDHGGRDTPTWWHLAAGALAAGTSTIPLPTAKIVLEGDHLVGYGAGMPPVAIDRADWTAAPAQLVPVSAVPPGLRKSSFHPDQTPDWLVLPADTAMITNVTGSRGGGGSHGACVDPHGAFSQIDGSVPLWWLGSTTSVAPSDLRGVASFFLDLR